MTTSIFFLCIALFIAGIGAYVMSDKERDLETNEWPSMLQWGYLLILIGLFGILAQFMSFTAVLLVFTVLTGIIWFINKRNIRLKKGDELTGPSGHFVDYLSGFFPIVLIVFILRTFIAEPFVIPSSSMRPGLIPGDFVLVNKFSYGIRLPVINHVLIPIGQVQRGDVAVFNYPVEPSVNFIKRIVGLPGDTVRYDNKQLFINQKRVDKKLMGDNTFFSDSSVELNPVKNVKEFKEQMGLHQFNVFEIVNSPTLDLSQVVNPDQDGLCQYWENGFECTIPEGKYFAMGDNRDYSADSRYWGFVDDKLLVGKAFLIWMNIKTPSRIGTRIQ